MIKNAKNVYSIFFISLFLIYSFIYSIDDYINIYISKVLYFSLKTI